MDKIRGRMMLPPSDVSSQGVRAKALEFLKDKFSTFNLLLTVSLAHGTARITNYCFELVNADKADLVKKQGERAAARMRIRIRSKGPEAFQDLQDPQSRLHFHGVTVRCQSFVNTSWTQLLSEAHQSTTAAVPCAYWPRDEPVTLRHKMVAEDVLRNIAAIKWRMVDRFATPPWSFSKLVLANVDPQDWSRSLQSFLEISPCCLDTWWSRPLQQHLKGSDPANREVFFQRAVTRFYASLRPVSLREEQSHAVQRKVAGGMHATALTSNIQRAASVVQTVKKNFELRGGRNLDFAVPKVIKAFKNKSKKKGHFSRPNQIGNAMFFYIAQKRKQGDNRSSSILTQEWKGLPPNTHEWWMAKYRTHLSIKRNQESDAKAFAAEQDPGGSFYEYFMGRWQCRLPNSPLILFALSCENTKGKELLWKHCKLLLILQTLGQQRLKSTSKRFQLGKSHIISRQLWD